MDESDLYLDFSYIPALDLVYLGTSTVDEK